jgi:hypothetical protein
MEELSSCVTTGISLDIDGGPWWQNGPLLMLLAAQAMAAGTLMVPWVTRFVDPVMATGWHMILGGLPLVAMSLVTEGEQLAHNLPLITPGMHLLCSVCSVLCCHPVL